MLGRSIWLFRYLECQNPSIFSDFIDRGRNLQQFQKWNRTEYSTMCCISSDEKRAEGSTAQELGVANFYLTFNRLSVSDLIQRILLSPPDTAYTDLYRDPFHPVFLSWIRSWSLPKLCLRISPMKQHSDRISLQNIIACELCYYTS